MCGSGEKGHDQDSGARQSQVKVQVAIGVEGPCMQPYYDTLLTGEHQITSIVVHTKCQDLYHDPFFSRRQRLVRFSNVCQQLGIAEARVVLFGRHSLAQGLND